MDDAAAADGAETEAPADAAADRDDDAMQAELPSAGEESPPVKSEEADFSAPVDTADAAADGAVASSDAAADDVPADDGLPADDVEDAEEAATSHALKEDAAPLLRVRSEVSYAEQPARATKAATSPRASNALLRVAALQWRTSPHDIDPRGAPAAAAPDSYNKAAHEQGAALISGQSSIAAGGADAAAWVSVPWRRDRLFL